MLSFIDISGSHHAVGLALGRFGAKAVQHYAQTSPAWHHIMRFRGHAASEQMQQEVQLRHPSYWAEIEGLAQGLDMPVEDVFLWNCRGDLWAWGPDGCTTVWQPGTPNRLAHNEDGDPLFAGKCAMAHIRIDNKPGVSAFVYPGSLAGHTFGVNAAGLCMTVNNLRTLHAKPGLPRMVVTRAILDCTSITQALQYVRDVQPAGGFHVTLAQPQQQHMVSLEFTSRRCSSMDITACGGHANHLIHTNMAHQPQIITGSSGFRQERLRHCLEAQPAIEPLTVLFDTHNDEFPIYRQAPDDPDSENTLASARFEVNSDTVRWQVHQGQSFDPTYKFNNDRLITTISDTETTCKMVAHPHP